MSSAASLGLGNDPRAQAWNLSREKKLCSKCLFVRDRYETNIYNMYIHQKSGKQTHQDKILFSVDLLNFGSVSLKYIFSFRRGIHNFKNSIHGYFLPLCFNTRPMK